MNVTDFVWISIGEFLLAATFALGMLVGMALKRKEPRNGDGNS